MNKNIKKVMEIISNLKIWYSSVFLEHNHTKLGFYHKLRAIRYGFSSDLYNAYNLKINDPHLYINEYNRIKSRDIDGEYKVILDNKIIFEQTFKKYLNIPKNKIIILNELYDNDGSIISEEQLGQILDGDKFIIKPASNTGGGSGVALIERTKNEEFLFDGKLLTIKELYSTLLNYNNYVINDYINQHDYSSKINPYSVNTIRVITIKDPRSNEYLIPIASHRFGCHKSGIVDNVSSGGIVTKVDVDSGMLLESKNLANLESFDSHPDTGVRIYGTMIPRWNEIKETLINVSGKFPYIPFIAWDVVVTNDGFKIIEGNASSSIELFQVFGTIMDTKLGEFYKYYGYIKK